MKKIFTVLAMLVCVSLSTFALNPKDVAPENLDTTYIAEEVKSIEEAGWKAVYYIVQPTDLDTYDTLGDALNAYFNDVCDFTELNSYDGYFVTNLNTDENGEWLFEDSIVIEGVITYDGLLAVIVAWFTE